jgi:hypothetical protein
LRRREEVLNLGALARTLLFAWRIKSLRMTKTLEISPGKNDVEKDSAFEILFDASVMLPG